MTDTDDYVEKQSKELGLSRGQVVDKLVREKKMEWISVKDESPDNDTICVVGCFDNTYQSTQVFYQIQTYRNKVFFNDSFDMTLNNITHWMPLPKPPKEQS